MMVCRVISSASQISVATKYVANIYAPLSVDSKDNFSDAYSYAQHWVSHI